MGASQTKQRGAETATEETKRSEMCGGEEREEATRGDAGRTGRTGQGRGAHEETQEEEDHTRTV